MGYLSSNVGNIHFRCTYFIQVDQRQSHACNVIVAYDGHCDYGIWGPGYWCAGPTLIHVNLYPKGFEFRNVFPNAAAHCFVYPWDQNITFECHLSISCMTLDCLHLHPNPPFSSYVHSKHSLLRDFHQFETWEAGSVHSSLPGQNVTH